MFKPEAAVPTTGAVPKLVPLAVNTTDPVGPAPLLAVAIVAVNCTLVVVVGVAVFAETPVAVCAAVIVTAFVADVLPV